MVQERLPVRFILVLVAVAAVHVCLGGALWQWSRMNSSTPPAETGQGFEVTPPPVPGQGSAMPVMPVTSTGTGTGTVTPASGGVTPGYTTHKVAPGESYWAIASRYRTTVGELQRLNGHAPNKVLQPGETLKVPKL